MTKIEFYKIHASSARLYFKLQNSLMLRMSEIYQSRLNGITSVLVIRFWARYKYTITITNLLVFIIIILLEILFGAEAIDNHIAKRIKQKNMRGAKQ
jgi:uncharacterized protein YegP (UPF0339 family)